LRVRAADGAYRIFETTAVDLRDDPAIAGLLVTSRDITARRAAERERQTSDARLARVVEHIAEVITITDVDGNWVSSSPAANRVPGYPPDHEPVGSLLEFVHPDDIAVASTAISEVLAGTRGPLEPVEIRIRAADGSYRIMESTAADLRHEPAIQGLLITHHDVTQRRAAEDGLRRTTSQLSALVSSLHDA